MALLAMEQTAHMLCGLNPHCAVFRDRDELACLFAQRSVAIWLPSRMALADPAIEQDWSMTSDSLALWLAGRLGAAGVVMVKSAVVPEGHTNVVQLQQAGLLDDAFHRYIEASRCPLHLVHRSNSRILPELLGASKTLSATLRTGCT
jgi:aspartokinase-like uncharacterized kinase